MLRIVGTGGGDFTLEFYGNLQVTNKHKWVISLGIYELSGTHQRVIRRGPR